MRVVDPLAQDASERVRRTSVIQSSDRTILQEVSDMVAEPGRPGMDIVMAQSFQMVGKVTAGTYSEEETLKEKLEDEKQKEEGGVASFPAALDDAVDHFGSSSDSAGNCRMDTLMKTMNRLDELSREAENCWAWMKATYLDDEKWYRVLRRGEHGGQDRSRAGGEAYAGSRGR